MMKLITMLSHKSPDALHKQNNGKQNKHRAQINDMVENVHCTKVRLLDFSDKTFVTDKAVFIWHEAWI